MARTWSRLTRRGRRLGVALRLHARDGRRRAGGSLVPVLQAAVAAALAFSLARYVIGHPYPFFAPVAAWVCLGFTRNRQPRRVAELGAGAVLGVLTGELLHLLIGSGPWQIGVVLVVAALGARFVDRGDLFTMQAGVNAMVVLATFTLVTSDPVGRAVDALVGALVALVLAVLLPRDVTSRPKRYIASVLTESQVLLRMVADGLRSGDTARLRDARTQLRGVRDILDYGRTVVGSSSQVARLNPTLRRDLPVLAELERQAVLLRRMLNTVELLVRQGRGVVGESGPQPVVAMLVAEAAGVTGQLAGSVREWSFPTEARRRAANLAAECAPSAVMHSTWRSVALVSVMRSVTVDLLQLTGLSREAARAELPDLPDSREVEEAAEGPDGASGIWAERP
ncbi:MAG: FUSC family protein [Propionicimonas sp.]